VEFIPTVNTECTFIHRAGFVFSGLYASPIHQESFLWIESMASPDPYYALPILTSATMLLTMFLGWMLRGLTPNWKIATLMTAAAGISAYVSSTLPAVW